MSCTSETTKIGKVYFLSQITGKNFSKITDILFQIHLRKCPVIRRIHGIIFMAFHVYVICEIDFVSL